MDYLLTISYFFFNSSSLMLDKEPLVSIIMNCYNGQRYLKAALDSVEINHIKIGKLFFGIIVPLIIVLR